MASRRLPSRLAWVRSLRTVSVVLAAGSFATSAHAAVIDADPTNYQSLVSSLAPGDTLRLASGTYTQGLSLSGKAGTASQPIIVSGPQDQSAVFTARDCCNTVQLQDTSYLEVLNLTLDGVTRSGSSSVDSRGNSHHITLENLRIIGHGGSQTAGISTQGPAWNWIIRHDLIIGTGTGIHLGNADGTQPFVAGLIEHNVVLDTAGSTLEIEGQLERPTGIGLPAGNSVTIIRHNLFSNRSGTVRNDDARPNVLLGHLPASDTGMNDRYDVYGNVNPAGAAVTVEPDAPTRSILAVTAAPTPTVTLSASPAAVAAGGTSTLSWVSTDASGCSASGGWTGTKAPSGSETVGPLQTTTSFQLTCLGAGGNANAITQVTVGGASSPPTTPPPTTPPPTAPPTTPTPTTPTPTTPTPTTGTMKSGGGGSLDAIAIGCLALVACLRRRRPGAGVRKSR